MPRRAAATVRKIEPDAVHRSRLVQQVINKVMLDGKKSIAEKIVYDALAIIGEKSGKDPLEQLEASIKSLTPNLEVRSRRVGGATYQVPVEVPAPRARTLAIRWLVEFARNRREKTMAQRLANELMDAVSQQGGAYKRKDDIYRMAQANSSLARSMPGDSASSTAPGIATPPGAARMRRLAGQLASDVGRAHG